MRSGVGTAWPLTFLVLLDFLLELFPDFEEDAEGLDLLLLFAVAVEFAEAACVFEACDDVPVLLLFLCVEGLCAAATRTVIAPMAIAASISPAWVSLENRFRING